MDAPNNLNKPGAYEFYTPLHPLDAGSFVAWHEGRPMLTSGTLANGRDGVFLKAIIARRRHPDGIVVYAEPPEGIIISKPAKFTTDSETEDFVNRLWHLQKGF